MDNNINKINEIYLLENKNKIINVMNHNNSKFINHNNKIKIIIITTKLIESIAINLYKFLREFKINVCIKYNLSESECINSKLNDIYLFIGINMLTHKIFPKKFILYQVEQISSNKNYLDISYPYLNNGINIWEFSIRNKEKYNNINLNKIYYQMIPYYFDNINNDDNNDYDLFFYGYKNIRREKILNYLSSLFNLKIGFDVYGDKCKNIILKSKIILNIHYYDNASLETCRINEILNYNKIIISENPVDSDWYNKSLYENIVDFVDVIDDDLHNINNLVDKIKYYMDDNNYNNKINKIKDNKIILHNKSKFNLYKNLFNIINLDNYFFDYDLEKDNIYCLHLLETPNRINEFKKINKDINIEIFPAFKYNPGWKGCGLSYVNLLYNAKRCNLDNITICEDDCKFPLDFNNKYNIIKEFLSKINWDIFVGVIADLPNDANILNIYEYKNIKFIQISNMTSAVFNIYNHTSYDTIIKWNLYDNNILNTIDRSFNNKNLIFIVTYPFYFSCLNVNSTLWNGDTYNNYNKMIKNSLDVLDHKIKNYKNEIKILN